MNKTKDMTVGSPTKTIFFFLRTRLAWNPIPANI